MLQFLIAFSSLGLFTGDVLSCKSDSSTLLPHSCPLVEKSSEYRQLQLSDPQCNKDTTLTSDFDGANTDQRSVQPHPELMATSLNMTSGSTSAWRLSGHFSYDLHMGLFLDRGLRRAVNPEVELALRQRLWVKLEVRGVTAEALGLTVQHCWATNEPSPHVSTQHSLITDGCPNPGEATVAVISNGVSLTSIFSFRAFRFVSELSRDVFLHCKARLCILAHNCVPSCTHVTKS